MAEEQHAAQDSDLPEGLSRPALRALTAAGYTRLEQFTTVSEAQVLHLHGMGPKALQLLHQALADTGRSFAEATESHECSAGRRAEQ